VGRQIAGTARRDAVTAGQWHFWGMTENTQNPSEVPYDPDQDADTDPDMLNPRAEGAEEGEDPVDPDRDPGNLNPRDLTE
jgi:hypothetical protein